MRLEVGSEFDLGAVFPVLSVVDQDEVRVVRIDGRLALLGVDIRQMIPGRPTARPVASTSTCMVPALE